MVKRSLEITKIYELYLGLTIMSPKPIEALRHAMNVPKALKSSLLITEGFFFFKNSRNTNAVPTIELRARITYKKGFRKVVKRAFSFFFRVASRRIKVQGSFIFKLIK